MPDTNPKSNIRSRDWKSGLNYKKYDSRYYQHSFVDTANSINKFSGNGGQLSSWTVSSSDTPSTYNFERLRDEIILITN